MSNPLRSAQDYEFFIYSLASEFPSIQHSAVTFVRRGATLARVTGEIVFDHGFRLIVRERLSFDLLPGQIEGYGYELWQDDQKLCWYDSQPHPDDPSLQSTHPHHKHIPPDIKHHRVPAENMSFHQPNLPALIREIELLLEARERSATSP